MRLHYTETVLETKLPKHTFSSKHLFRRVIRTQGGLLGEIPGADSLLIRCNRNRNLRSWPQTANQ